jgi:hypothetical protein
MLNIVVALSFFFRITPVPNFLLFRLLKGVELGGLLLLQSNLRHVRTGCISFRFEINSGTASSLAV